MHWWQRSIRSRTASLLLSIYVVFFGLILTMFIRSSSSLFQTQARGYTAKALNLMRTSLDATLNSSLLSMYAYLEDEQMLFGDRDVLKNHFSKLSKSSDKLGVVAVMDADGPVFIDSPKWLYDLNIDANMYMQMARTNRLLITEPYYSPMLTSRVVAIIRSLQDESTGQERILVGEIATRNLFDDLLITLSSGETIVALSSDGSTVFMDYASQLLPKAGMSSGLLDISGEMRNALTGMTESSATLTPDGRTLIVQKTTSAQGWALYWLTDANQFNQALNLLRRPYLLIAAVAIALLMGVSFLMSGWVLNPVRRLADEMDRISSDVPKPLPAHAHADEIGRLYNSFASLMERLHIAHSEAMASEHTRHKLEYRVLQSQIQPHFLLNINRCLSSLLEGGATVQARDMLENMDSLLRLSLDKRDMIPLAEEIEILRRYGALQKLRLGETFDLSIEGWEPLGDVQVPKLLLQPLVENALRHGLAGMPYPGEINVRVIEINGLIHITVSDNGRGMSSERMEEVRQGENRPHQGIVSIGLDNIRSRIASHYGPDCGLYISSRMNIGTVVEVVISKAPNG